MPPEFSTEDNILNNIPDFADEGNNEQGNATEGEGDQSHSSAQPTQQTGAVGEGSGVGGGADNAGQQTQQRQQPNQRIVRRHDGLIEQPNADNPNTRDLVDPVTGQVVAKGGIERRVFETGQRHARENQTLKQQLQQAQQQMGAVNEVSRVANELQIAPENQIAAIRVMSDFLKDPVKTLEYLVSEVKAKGYNIPFLQQGVTPGMDLQAVGRMIDQRMAPLTAQQQAAAQEHQQREAARQELDGFLETYPDANANLSTIGQMLQAQPGLKLHDAFIKLVMWANQNQFDYTQPLEPQIQARQTTQNTTQPTQQVRNQPRGQRPLPNGRSATANVQQVGNAKQYNENSSWADIIKDAMTESGSQF